MRDATAVFRSDLRGPVWVVAIVALLWFLRAAGSLLIPVALAVCISYALEPLVCRLARWIPRWLAAGLVLLVIAAAVGWVGVTLRDEAVAAVSAGKDALVRLESMLSSQIGRPQGATGLAASPPLVERGAGLVMTFVGDLATVVFLVFFLLAAGDHFRNRILEITSRPDDRVRAAQILRDINAQVQRFLLVRLATGALVAVATWIVLALMHTPQAGVWGVLAGAFNAIPYFGPIIVSGGLFAVGLVQSGDVVTGLEMAGAALVITSIEGWVITPPLLGRTERMSAVVVFVGLLLWTWIWGAWGTLLAVPMLVVTKAVADHVDRLAPLSRLMAP